MDSQPSFMGVSWQVRKRYLLAILIASIVVSVGGIWLLAQSYPDDAPVFEGLVPVFIGGAWCTGLLFALFARLDRLMGKFWEDVAQVLPSVIFVGGSFGISRLTEPYQAYTFAFSLFYYGFLLGALYVIPYGPDKHWVRTPKG